MQKAITNKAMAKDINLFTAYKEGSPRNRGGSSKGIVITVIIFACIIASIYLGLFAFRLYRQDQMAGLKAEAMSPEIAGIQERLAVLNVKNSLLRSYYTALAAAGKNFKASRIIDSEFLMKISSSLPADFIVSGITVNYQGVSITGTFSEKLAPAVFKQALDNLDLFATVSYKSIVNDEGKYYVILNCLFGNGGEVR